MKPYCSYFTGALLVIFMAVFLPGNAVAQAVVSNTNEEKVPPYILPDPLTGKRRKENKHRCSMDCTAKTVYLSPV